MRELQRAALAFMMRPLTSFICYLLVVTIVVLVPRSGPSLVLFYMVLPWLFLIVVALNMQFISLVFRRFTLSDAIKKNHALEHGTIFVLRRRYGAKSKLGGVAERDCFRVSGVQKKEHVQDAFKELLKEFKRGNSDIIVFMRCGTNIAAAQGFGIILLSLSAVGLLMYEVDAMMCLIVLCINVLLYFLLRIRLGNRLQNRFFLSLGFSNAKIQSIYRVEKRRFWERNPVGNGDAVRFLGFPKGERL